MKIHGYVAFDTDGKPFCDSYNNVLLFKTPEKAREEIGIGAVKIKPVITAKVNRSRKTK